jgi:hypothetical protein
VCLLIFHVRHPIGDPVQHVLVVLFAIRTALKRPRLGGKTIGELFRTETHEAACRVLGIRHSIWGAGGTRTEPLALKPDTKRRPITSGDWRSS